MSVDPMPSPPSLSPPPAPGNSGSLFETLGDVVGFLDNSSSFLVASIVILGAARAQYRRTIGSRRELASKLNKLACGVNREYVDNLLGPAAIRRSHQCAVDYGKPARDVTEWIHRTDHAWVTVVTDDEVVIAFSITAINPRFHFSTDTLTFGMYPVLLGRSTFTALGDYNSRLLAIGSRLLDYGELHYAGNPGAYQHYYFSSNNQGVGNGAAGPLPPGIDVGGTYADDPDGHPYAQSFPEDDQGFRRFRDRLIVNTLTIVGPMLSDPGALLREWQGVHGDVVRTLRS